MSAGLPGLSCREVQELAPELGLGVLGGVERARALVHLESCPSCRALVEDMAEVGDRLLGLAPEVEPPAGFEARLLARCHHDREALSGTGSAASGSGRAGPAGSGPAGPAGLARTWARRHRWPALAAAATVVVAGFGVGLGLDARARQGVHGAPLEAVAVPGGHDASGTLGDQGLSGGHQGGREVGQVFVHAGQPSWVFMVVEAHGPPRQVTCQLKLEGGRTVTLGTFTVSTGYRSWGSTVALDPSLVVGVQLLNAQHATVASARL